MNSDFVITMKTQSGDMIFWDGKRGWASVVTLAHSYATREAAVKAMKRKGWDTNPRIGYMTKWDVRDLKAS